MRRFRATANTCIYITVKKIGKGLVEEDDSGDQNRDALVNYSINTIKPWLQDAWDAIRSDNGKNSKGRYYTDYIDIESFAKMYLLHEYVKGPGLVFFQYPPVYICA